MIEPIAIPLAKSARVTAPIHSCFPKLFFEPHICVVKMFLPPVVKRGSKKSLDRSPLPRDGGAEIHGDRLTGHPDPDGVRVITHLLGGGTSRKAAGPV